MGLYNELYFGIAELWLMKQRYQVMEIGKISRPIGIVSDGQKRNDLVYVLLVDRVYASVVKHTLESFQSLH